MGIPSDVAYPDFPFSITKEEENVHRMRFFRTAQLKKKKREPV